MKQWMCDGGWEWWAGGSELECDIISGVFYARLAEWDRKLIPEMRWCIAKWTSSSNLSKPMCARLSVWKKLQDFTGLHLLVLLNCFVKCWLLTNYNLEESCFVLLTNLVVPFLSSEDTLETHYNAVFGVHWAVRVIVRCALYWNEVTREGGRRQIRLYEVVTLCTVDEK